MKVLIQYLGFLMAAMMISPAIGQSDSGMLIASNAVSFSESIAHGSVLGDRLGHLACMNPSEGTISWPDDVSYAGEIIADSLLQSMFRLDKKFTSESRAVDYEIIVDNGADNVDKAMIISVQKLPGLEPSTFQEKAISEHAQATWSVLQTTLPSSGMNGKKDGYFNSYFLVIEHKVRKNDYLRRSKSYQE